MPVYGNPIASGLNAFSAVAGMIDAREQRKYNRELMDLEVQREKRKIAKEEKHEKSLDELKPLVKKMAESMQNPYDGLHEDTEMMQTFAGAIEKKPQDMTEQEKQSLFWGAKESNLGGRGKQNLQEIVDKLPEKKADIEKINAFIESQPQILEKGGTINWADMPPDISKAYANVFGFNMNDGTSLFGEVGKDKVTKTPSRTIIDPKTKALVDVVKVTQPVEEGQVFNHIQPGGTTGVYMAPSNASPDGLISGGIGNIDLTKQKVVGHADGSVSTVYSGSFPDEMGNEVLVPLSGYPDGRTRTIEEAKKEYGNPKSPYFRRHLGIFETAEQANNYAQKLSSDPMWEADKKTFSVQPGQKERWYEAPVTVGRDANPKAPIDMQPIGLKMQQAKYQHQLYTKILSVMADIDPAQTFSYIRGIEDRQTANKARKEAIAAVDPGAKTPTQRRQYMKRYFELNPDADVKEVAEMAKLFIEEKPDKSKTKYDLAYDAAGGDEQAREAFEMGEKAEKDTSPSNIKEFEAFSGMAKEDRGTDEYKVEYKDFIAMKKAKAGGGEGGGSKKSEEARIGDYTAVDKRITELFLPTARADAKNATGNDNTDFEDPVSGSISSPKVYESLHKENKGRYDRVKILAQKYVSSMTPAEAVDQALKDIKHGTKEAPAATSKKPVKSLTSQAEASTGPTKKPAAKQQVMDKLPPASQYSGKTARDTTTGKRYKSNGKSWIEVK